MYLEEKLNALEERINRLESPRHLQDRWLTVRELSKEMNISEATIRRHIKDGSIKTATLFGAVRIPMSQFY